MSEDRRVPVTVLTGFLGSGKTTLLNHILKCTEHGLRFAIIENEFGQVGVDEHLLNKDTKMQGVNEEVVEVMNGCICCTVRGDLVEALKRLHKKVEHFDAVLIETTGMADPAPVAQTFFVDEDIQKLYSLDGIITVVDAKHLLQHLDEEKPEGVENESEEQIAFADRIILNKCDLVCSKYAPADSKAENADDLEVAGNESKKRRACDLAGDGAAGDDEGEKKLAQLEARIAGINSSAKIVRASFSKVEPKELLNISGFDLKRVLAMDPEFLSPESADHEHDDSVSSVSVNLPGMELNVNKLQRWVASIVQELGTELFRYKGVLAVKGMDEKFVFQGVHMMFSGGFASEMLGSEGAGYWKEGEERSCRFVFIGKNVKQQHGERLVEEFKECAAEPNLRFKLGDEVEALTQNGWQKAKVIKLWDRGNPYRLDLANGGRNIWGPLDSSRCVRPIQ